MVINGLKNALRSRGEDFFRFSGQISEKERAFAHHVAEK